MSTTTAQKYQALGLDVDHGPEAFGDVAVVNSEEKDGAGEEDKGSEKAAPAATARPESFDIAASGEETVFQAFRRLRTEVAAFVASVEREAKTQAASTVRDVGGSPAQLQRNLEALARQLEELSYEDKNKPHLNPHDTDRNGTSAAAQKLLSELQIYTDNDSVEGKPTRFEMLFEADQKNYSRYARVTEMSRRVAELEKLVGTDDLNGSGSMRESVASLEKRLNSLDTHTLQAIHKRLEAALVATDAAEEDAGDVDGNGTSYDGVDALHETMVRWDPMAAQLPGLIQRLQALQALHEQAASFGNNLRRVELGQAALGDAVQAERSLLARMDESFAANVRAIEENCAVLERRMAALQEAVKKV